MNLSEQNSPPPSNCKVLIFFLKLHLDKLPKLLKSRKSIILVFEQVHPYEVAKIVSKS